MKLSNLEEVTNLSNELFAAQKRLAAINEAKPDPEIRIAFIGSVDLRDGFGRSIGINNLSQQEFDFIRAIMRVRFETEIRSIELTLQALGVEVDDP